MDEQGRGRIYWIESLRAYAAFAVVLVHSSSGLVFGKGEVAAADWWVGVFFDVSGRWCVPAFVMVSGYFLLDPSRNESARDFYRKRLSRLLVPLVSWTVLYSALNAVSMAGQGKMFQQIFNRLALRLSMGLPQYHMWFVYMLFGLYFVTPVLRTYLRSSSARSRGYLILSIFVLAGANDALMCALRPGERPTVFVLFVPYIAYYLCGHHLRTGALRWISAKVLVCVIAGCYLSIALLTGFLLKAIGNDAGMYFARDWGPPHVVMSISIFLLAARLGRRGEERRGPSQVTRFVSTRIAPATLGIYLAHPLALAFLKKTAGFTAASFAPLLSIPLLALSAFALSYAAVMAVRKVPYLRRAVG